MQIDHHRTKQQFSIFFSYWDMAAICLGQEFLLTSWKGAVSSLLFQNMLQYLNSPGESISDIHRVLLQINSQTQKEILIKGRIVKKKAKFNSDLLLTPVSKISVFQWLTILLLNNWICNVILKGDM